MTSQSGGISTPSGPAGGVLGGTFPNPTYVGGLTTPIITTFSALLTGNVTRINANQFYDGPLLVLPAGSFFMVGQVLFTIGGGASDITLRLWDGTTTYYDTQERFANTGTGYSLAIGGEVVLAAPATMRLSVADTAAGGVIVASASANGSTNHACALSALRTA